MAMGCMGMSMNDFCRCAPSEFHEAYEAWSQMQESRERSQWERMRLQCLCSLQPYSKDRLSPRDIMRFPWEEEGEEEEGTNEKSPCQERQRELSHEEVMARYREAAKRAGLN